MAIKRRLKIKLIGILTLPIYLTAAFLSFFRPDWLLTYGALTKWIGWLTLALVVLPLGGIVLGDQKTKASRFSWFTRLFVGQMAIMLLFVGAVLAFLGAGPSFSQGNFSLDSAWQVVGSYTQTHWGIFPWSIYAAFGVVLSYFYHVRKLPPFVHCVGSPTFKGKFQSRVKGFVEGLILGGNNTAMGLMLATIILLMAYGLQLKFQILHHFVIPFIAMMVFSFVLMFLLLKGTKRLIRRLTRSRMSLTQFSGVFVFIMVSTILLIGKLAAWFIHKVPESLSLSQCESCSKYFDFVTSDVRLAALYWAFWMLFLPMGASWLAKMAKGRTIREVVIGVMWVPFGWMALTSLYPNMNLYVLVENLRVLPTQFICFVMAVLCALIYWRMTTRTYDSRILSAPFMDLSFMGSKENFSNRNRLDTPSKITGLSRFLAQLFASSIGILLIHSVGGWYFIQFQLTAFAPLLTFIVYMAILIFAIQIFRDNRYKAEIKQQQHRKGV